MPGVVDVRFAEREPAEKRNLLSWEQVGKKITLKMLKADLFTVTFITNELHLSLRKILVFCQKTCEISI